MPVMFLTGDRNHQLFYQLTRITKDLGALKHDDVLECVAGAAAFWTERLDQDMSGAEEDHKRDELNVSLIGGCGTLDWRPESP